MTRKISIASMFVGGTMYVLFRPETLKMFTWIANLRLSHPVNEIRCWSGSFSHMIPDWMYLSLPQALWLFSGCLAIHSIWRNSRCRQEQLWMLAVAFLAVGGEFGQAVGLVKGVFDPIDLSLIVLAFMAAQALAFYDSVCSNIGRSCT